MFSVSRLEFHKGILDEFAVIEQLLKWFPQLSGKFRFLKTMPINSEYVTLEKYRVLRETIFNRVTELNSRFKVGDWFPIVLESGPTLPHSELAGRYRAADVQLVFSSSDGFNHTSIECVLSKQKGDPSIILLLSDTGSSDYLGSGFIHINPSSISTTTLSLYRALIASESDRKALHTNLLAAAISRTAEDWMNEILLRICDEKGDTYV